MKTCLIEIKVGDPVMDIETGKHGILRDIKMTPNGMNSPGIVAIFCVEMDLYRGRGIKSATSNNFAPIDDYDYAEHFPSVNASRVSDSLKNIETEYKPSHG